VLARQRSTWAGTVSGRALIVASGTRAPWVNRRCTARQEERLDYFELARQTGARLLDYDSLGPSSAASRLEQRLKLDLRLALFAAWTAASEGVEVVFSTSERVGLPLALLLRPGVRHYLFGHNLLSRNKLPVLRRTWALRRPGALLAPTRVELTELRRVLRASRIRTGLLPIVCDERFFRPQPRPPAARRVLSLGLAHRDYATLAAALSSLPSVTCNLSDASLWMRRDRTAATTLPANLQRQPWVPLDRLPEIFAAAAFVAIVLQPGTTQAGAGGASALRAQAMGRAVVATRTSGLSELVLDGVTGLLVPARDPQALADAIDQLWRDQARADRLGRNGRAWIETSYSFERWLRQAAALIERDQLADGTSATFDPPCPTG
jgi:glycosyltransferase involved in cell wall biosynthesis